MLNQQQSLKVGIITETCQLIFNVNQLTGFYMTASLVITKLMHISY